MRWRIRRLYWYYLRPGKVCGKFVPDPHSILKDVYCRVCGYDNDIH